MALLLALAALPAAAQSRLEEFPDMEDETGFEFVQEDGARVTPSEAAAIAQDAVPGAKLLKVKLLSSGVYAVTLRAKGSVIRVMVSADDGSIQ